MLLCLYTAPSSPCTLVFALALCPLLPHTHACTGTSSEKSINACGNGLPSGFNPVCDPFLGLTQACECSGISQMGRAAAERFSARSPRATRVTFTPGAFFGQNAPISIFENIAPIRIKKVYFFRMPENFQVSRRAPHYLANPLPPRAN